MESNTSQVADAGRNRELLHKAGVFSVSIVGGPGCGKSTLIRRTIGRLAPALQVAVVAAGPDAHDNAIAGGSGNVQVVYVNGAAVPCLNGAAVATALHQLDLPSLDLLFIENVGSLTIPIDQQDVGQDATVTVFSVAAGDDKARKHAELVRASDAVLLNKVDLLPAVPFDLATFRRDVTRANPSADLFEVSALAGRGVDAWANWLRQRVDKVCCQCADASHWFG